MSNSIGSWAELEQFLSENGFLAMEEDMVRIAEEQSAYLESLVKDEISAYYASYTPDPQKGGYERTYNLMNSIIIEPPEIEGSTITFAVGFDETLSTHPSLWGGDDSYMPYEISVGWHINWSKPYRIPRLSDYDGWQYIPRVVEKYNETNGLGIIVHAYMNGEGVD